MQFSNKNKNEKEMFDLMEKELTTAVICDILDDFGYRKQIMDSAIRPLDFDYVVAGRAMTILTADVYTQPDKPYETEIEAVDSIKPNEIVVAATNLSSTSAFWGELLSTAAIARGSRGAIIYGGTRDLKKIKAMGFKVFTSVINPLDSKGRAIVIDYGCPIDCGGVILHPGDIVFADCDGIAVIPKDIEDRVIAASLEKITKERHSLEMLKSGALLKDVFDKFGVL